MSEPQINDVLADLRRRHKDAHETAERLARVIDGLEVTYAKNAKTAQKMGGGKVETGTAAAPGRNAKVADMRPKIEALLLEGAKPGDVIKKLGAKPSAVYGISSALRKSGKLKGLQ